MKRKGTADRTGRRRGPARIASPVVVPSELPDPILVTGLEEVAGRPGRVGVELSGVQVGVVTLDAVADLGLRTGKTLSPPVAGEVVTAARRTAVLDKALDLLAVRARSARDLSIRLRRAGAGDADIAWATDRLAVQGFVDDAAYARQVARAKVLSGGVSRRRVVSVLRKRGVSADIAEAAIEDTLGEVSLDEEGAALEAARKRLRSLVSLDPATRRKRLYAFLARRGYDGDVVRRVLREVLGP